MTLLNQPVQVYGALPKLFETLRQGQAPENFNREFLRDIGFKSSNHHAFIPLLKGLGFLTADGAPTERYKALLDETRWRKVIAEAIKEAYSDIFVLKNKPTKSDLPMIKGKYKSTYNVSDVQAERSARTFLALLSLADEDTLYGTKEPAPQTKEPEPENEAEDAEPPEPAAPLSVKEKEPSPLSLNYNIQIHLPATKDIEVYNAIFRSIREHLIE